MSARESFRLYTRGTLISQSSKHSKIRFVYVFHLISHWVIPGSLPRSSTSFSLTLSVLLLPLTPGSLAFDVVLMTWTSTLKKTNESEEANVQTMRSGGNSGKFFPLHFRHRNIALDFFAGFSICIVDSVHRDDNVEYHATQSQRFFFPFHFMLTDFSFWIPFFIFFCRTPDDTRCATEESHNEQNERTRATRNR